jgi:hypothetical protein
LQTSLEAIGTTARQLDRPQTDAVHEGGALREESSMKPTKGDKVKVCYVDGGFTYTFDVEVTEVLSSTDFAGRVESISSDRAELTGGDIVALKGQTKSFKTADIIGRK